MQPVVPPLFAFEAVTVSGSDGRHRLRDVTATFAAPGVTAIVGPSGSGKTTLLRCCNRLDVPASGVVRFRGDDLGALDVLGLRRRVGMVFQRPIPFAGTCADNLRVADPALDDSAAAALLDRVGLDGGFVARDAREISGGEAQRLCLARALAVEPEVLLVDEPTASLDATSRAVIEGVVRDLAAAGVAVLWVSHDLDQVTRVADDVVVVVDGRVVGPEAAARYLAGGDRA